MKKIYTFLALLLPFIVLVSGCGQPPAGGGPPSEFPVRAVVALVEPRPMEETVRLVGSLRADQQIDVVSELSGTITGIHFTQGQAVEQGAELITIRDDRIRARLQEAEARYDLAAANLARGRDLLETETISQSDFDRLHAEYQIAIAAKASANVDLVDTKVSAPFDGVITARRVNQGAFVQVGQVITSLIQLDPLDAVFHLPERYLRQVAKGQIIRLRAAAHPEEIFEGEVHYIDPRVDELNRTVQIKALVDNADGKLKPGMFISLDLVLEVAPEALVIPEAAVQYFRDQARVFVMGEDDRAERRDVSIGRRLAGELQITSGLEPGDRVVVEGFQKMGPGSRIIISPDSAAFGVEPPEPTDPVESNDLDEE